MAAPADIVLEPALWGSPPTGSYRSDMPGIGACTPLNSPPEEIQRLLEAGNFTEVSYRSPQGEVELKLDHCVEFGWDARCGLEVASFENGQDQSERHRQLLTYLAENHPYSTAGLHPWNRAGDKLAIPTV